MDSCPFAAPVGCNSRSTRSDRVFAALQGPILGLSTGVLHRGGRFVLELLVPESWRSSRSLSPAAVRSALLRPSLCHASTLLPVGSCPRCRRTLDVFPGIATATPLQALPQGLESYTATVVPRCSSPRRHMGCGPLVLEWRQPH
eukprot:m51a1_g7326 hypothetical protein (144) ;mRNA; r:159458-160016